MMKYKNKREFERAEISGLIADIADDKFVFDGLIEDVSVTGFKITQLPKQLELKLKKYVTVISGYKRNFKIVIKPCWAKKTHNGYYQEVGFKIINPPWAWTEFIQTMLPEKESVDVWGSGE